MCNGIEMEQNDMSASSDITVKMFDSKKVTTHPDIAHPFGTPPATPTMKGIPFFRPLVKVARGVFQFGVLFQQPSTEPSRYFENLQCWRFEPNKESIRATVQKTQQRILSMKYWLAV